MEVVYDETALEDYMRRALEGGAGLPILLDRFLEGAKEVDVDAVSDGRDVFVAGVMEHIEEAGIHSGDSACVLPPYSLSPAVRTQIETHTRRLAKALRVKGLLNIQYAVKDGTVYVLEANPRASRTVPFVSKAIGLPLAKIAAKVMVGVPLKKCLAPFAEALRRKREWSAVKEVVFPWMRFPEVDVVLGPEMRSTGEVMGIDEGYGLAFVKAQVAAGTHLPKQGTIFLSVRDKDKPDLLPLAREFRSLGYRLIATAGTARYLAGHGLDVETVKKVAEGRPHVVDAMRNGQIQLVINTPDGPRARSDGFHIRRTALFHNIPMLTTLSAARASVDGLRESSRHPWRIRSLQELHGAGERPSPSIPVSV
jgi:carbamoyl-phosphate synthase large subunit